MSSQPTINKPFPAFSLPAAIPQADGTIETTELTLEKFRGRPLVLFVYPRDATPGCTIEVCGFRDQHAEFEKVGVAVAGLSRDGLGAHKKFIQNQQIPYILLADKMQDTLKAWGLITDGMMYGKPVTRVSRTTFLIDGDGVLRQRWDNVTPLGHAAEVLKTCKNLGK